MQTEQAAEIARLKRLLAQREEEVAILKKGRSVLCQGVSVRYAWIKSQQGTFSIKAMCRVLLVRRSAVVITPGSAPERVKGRPKANAWTKAICRHFEAHKGRYGSPRVTEELKAEGWRVGRPRVAKRMRALGLKARVVRKYKVTTQSKHNLPVPPHFSVLRPTTCPRCDPNFFESPTAAVQRGS